jgi:hypothetical protein
MIVYLLMLAAMVAVTGLSPARAQAQGEMLNVKDYGAIGDGGADDTKALQAAFDAQRQPPYKTVYFPPGNYRITDTVRTYGLGMATDGASISQSDPAKDIFYVEFAWSGTLRNFTFGGGAKQLNLGNPNIDQGLVRIENCTFTNSKDFAVYMRKGSNSSHLIITGCKFSMCEQVLHATCDWTTLRDAWITTAWMDNKAAIEHRGAKLLLENVVGVPLVTGKDDRWIDNYGGLTCRNFRFGGEFGGMTPVWNFARTAVLLDDCYIGAQGSGKKAAVYCVEIPHFLKIRDSALTVPPVMLSSTIDLSTYYDHIGDGVLTYEVNGVTVDNGDWQKIITAVNKRDKRPIKPAGQVSAKQTKQMQAQLAALLRARPMETSEPATVDGRVQKTDPKDYVELTKNAVWDIEDFMDATTMKNSELLSVMQVGDDTVFMHRAGIGEGGVWPHALIRNVEIDLDQTPIISWKQKDPPAPFKPAGFPERSAALQLDTGVRMPMGFALRITDNATQRMVLLKETHTPPWFDYGAKDLRKLFDVTGGKRLFTIKYFPLGVYITGQPGTGFAIPGDYQILDFIRAERE